MYRISHHPCSQYNHPLTDVPLSVEIDFTRPSPAGVIPALTYIPSLPTLRPYEYGVPPTELDGTRYRRGGVDSVSASLDDSSDSSRPDLPDGGGITTGVPPSPRTLPPYEGSRLWYDPIVDGGSGTPAPV